MSYCVACFSLLYYLSLPCMCGPGLSLCRFSGLVYVLLPWVRLGGARAFARSITGGKVSKLKQNHFSGPVSTVSNFCYWFKCLNFYRAHSSGRDRLIEHIKLTAKLLDYFLRNNKRNIKIGRDITSQHPKQEKTLDWSLNLYLEFVEGLPNC